MRVLFVDDEASVLDGISRALFDIDDDWEVETALGGQEALAFLAEETVDVVVSDMRMPGMDGAALLREVHDRYPGTARIVLSGHSEMEGAVRAASVAHQFLSKPCNGQVLVAVIERAVQLQALIEGSAVQALVGDVTALPPVPRIFKQLTEMLADPNVGIVDVGKLVSEDPALSAKALQLVNSSFFSSAVTTTDPVRAVTRLGLSTIKSLALSAGVFSATGPFAKVEPAFIEGLQQQGSHVATLAKQIVAGTPHADDAFLAGLMCGLGELIVHAYLPDAWREIGRLQREESMTKREAEAAALGVSQAHVGAYLLGTWGLPYCIVEAVAYHAEPDQLSTHSGLDLAAALHVAYALHTGEPADTEWLEQLGVADRLPEWQALAGGSEERAGGAAA